MLASNERYKRVEHIFKGWWAKPISEGLCCVAQIFPNSPLWIIFESQDNRSRLFCLDDKICRQYSIVGIICCKIVMQMSAQSSEQWETPSLLDSHTYCWFQIECISLPCIWMQYPLNLLNICNQAPVMWYTLRWFCHPIATFPFYTC